MHFGLHNSNSSKQAIEIVDIIQEIKQSFMDYSGIFFVGDLNTLSNSSTYKFLMSKTKFRDALQESSDRYAITTYILYNIEPRNGSFIAKDITFVNATLLEPFGISDKYPLKAVFVH